MAVTLYSYTVGDTLNDKVNEDALEDEIHADLVILTAVSSITKLGENPGDALEIRMKEALGTGEESALDAVVAAHTGEGALPNLTLEGVAVTSFNGRQGDVTPQAGDYTAGDVGADPAGTAASLDAALTAGDVGADPAGTAASEIAAHEAAGDPHSQYTTLVEAEAAAPVQSVNSQTGNVSLTAPDVGADPAGTGASEAASAVSTHEAAGDPHPQYTTTAEASAAAPVQSVNGETGTVVLDATDVGADPAGTGASEAASAVSAHEAAGDPHAVYQLRSEKGSANGYASLDGNGRVPASQLSVSAFEFKGNWDASTNSPSLSSGVGTSGDTYRVSVAGSTTLDGISSWDVNDEAVFDGTQWIKRDNSDAVQSVNGQTGAVSLTAGDVGADPAGTAASEVASHEAAGDPHPQYTTTAEASAAAPVQSVNGETGAVQIDADEVPYDNSGSGLAATDAQAAIDEVLASIPGPDELRVGQYRRAASVALSGTQQVVFDNTDHENDVAVIQLNGGTPSEILLKEVGFYAVSYTAIIGHDDPADVVARAVLNGSTILPGSISSLSSDITFVGATAVTTLTATFLIETSSASDSIEVETVQTAGTCTLTEATVKVWRMKGSKGDKGDPGAGSSVLVEDGGTPLGSFTEINASVGLQATDAGSGQADLSIAPVRAEFGLSSGASFAPGPFQLPFDTTLVSHAAFTLNGNGSVTFNFTGEVRVKLEASFDIPGGGGSSRTQAESYLELAGTEIGSSRRQHYLRQSTHGTSASAERTISVTSGQSIAAFGVRTQGGSTVGVPAENQLLILERTA